MNLFNILQVDVVLYDVTTFLESVKQDNIRDFGFSKMAITKYR